MRGRRRAIRSDPATPNESHAAPDQPRKDEPLPAEIERRLFKTFLVWLGVLGFVFTAIAASVAFLLKTSILDESHNRATQ
jgi:hypothetical protein